MTKCKQCGKLITGIPWHLFPPGPERFCSGECAKQYLGLKVAEK